MPQHMDLLFKLLLCSLFFIYYIFALFFPFYAHNVLHVSLVLTSRLLPSSTQKYHFSIKKFLFFSSSFFSFFSCGAKLTAPLFLFSSFTPSRNHQFVTITINLYHDHCYFTARLQCKRHPCRAPVCRAGCKRNGVFTTFLSHLTPPKSLVQLLRRVLGKRLKPRLAISL